MRLPLPESSQAILIGASGYGSAALSDLPAVGNNLTALSEALTAPASGGFTADRCTVLADPRSVRDVYRAVHAVAADTADTLLVYYSGHGLIGARNELYLSLSDTDPDELAVSALPFSLLREIVSDSPATNRIVILDCCFSGRAIQGMGGADEALAGLVSIEGSYTLTSTAANAVALAPEGATYTAFTGELVGLLFTGVLDGPELLTFGTLYRHLLRAMEARNLPRPMCQGTGTVEHLAMVRNPRAGRLETSLEGTRPAPSRAAVRPAADAHVLARRQRETEMELLIGRLDGTGSILDYQHLPELYVERLAVDRAWRRFLDSDATVFAAVGEAGRGKTSLMCTLAAELGESAPVFFFNGSQLDGRLADAVAEGLGLRRTGADSLDAAVALARRQGHRLYVFVDALNERAVGRDDLRAELNELARGIRTHRWPIRLVVSCRSGDWPFWVRNARHMLGHFGRAVYRDEELADGSVPGTPVAAFDTAETEAAWNHYRRGFGLTGTFTEELRDLCREPLFLRLIAETFRGGSPAQAGGFSRPRLIDRFFEERFPGAADRMDAMAVLFRLAEHILARECPSVPVSVLPPETLPGCRRLMAEGVLTEKNGALGFRFEIVLEHVVARYLRQRLPDRPDTAEVAALVDRLTHGQLVNAPGVVENLLLCLEEPEAAPRSLELLADLDDRWRSVACTVAARIELPPILILPAVRILAAADNHLIRNRSAESIVRWVDGRADAEVAACTAGGDWESRETVAQALGRARKPSLRSTLLLWDLADDYHWRVRRASGYSLLRIWHREAVRETVGGALERPDRISWRRRHSVCVGMLGCDLAAAAPEKRAIEAMSRDSNLQVRWCVANYLSRYRNAAGSVVTAALVADPSDWVRARLVTSLIELARDAPDRILPLLSAMAADPSAAVRLKTARELPRLEHAGTRTALLRRLQDDVDDVSFAARYSLGLVSDAGLSLGSPTERAVILRVFRERVARGDVDVTHAHFSKFQTFISERAEVPSGEDPYMRVVDTMCSLVAAAMTALRENPAAVGELVELLEQDPDEAVRWALVLFLVRYNSRALMTPSARLAGLERLAGDPHWWVRREVAGGLVEFEHGTDRWRAAQLLDRLHQAELLRTEPCGDEVLYFVDRSAARLRGPGGPDDAARSLEDAR